MPTFATAATDLSGGIDALSALALFAVVMVSLFGMSILLVGLRKGVHKLRGAHAGPNPPALAIAASEPLAPSPRPAGKRLQDLSEEQFELLAAELFRRQGFDVEFSLGRASDESVDFRIRQGEEISLVKCYHRSNAKVGIDAIRKLLKAVESTEVRDGIFVTIGDYASESREFAENKPLLLLDRAELEEALSNEQRQNENFADISEWLPEFATSATLTTPSCPNCGTRLALREGEDSRKFWGCPTFPQCRCTLAARQELLPYNSLHRFARSFSEARR